jgi:purine nucleoside phosphorylase
LYAAVEKLVQGVDVVVSLLGAGRNKKTGLPVEKGVRAAVAAMKKFGVKKLVVLTSTGSYDKFSPTLHMKIMNSFLTDVVNDDHRAAENYLDSLDPGEIDWVTIHV